MSICVHIDIRNRPYPVLIGENLSTAEALMSYAPSKKYILIYDKALESINGGKAIYDVVRSAETVGEVESFSVPSGEASKSLTEYSRMLDSILDTRITRETVILALGGGVVGDLAGFVAASLLRGVDFVQIPTTLLAQVDSSVGGKVGINARAGKNLIGAFHQPKLVLADLQYLCTLSDRTFSSGMAEVIKAGLLADVDFLAWLKQHCSLIMQGDMTIRQKMVEWAVNIKAGVVRDDETERSGRRALLNLGHTFGHGLEALLGYDQARLMHGEAVSIGTVMAAQLSEKLGMISRKDVHQVVEIFSMFKLPCSAQSLGNQISPLALWEAMQYDKKNMGSGLKLVLLESLGKALLCPAPDADIVTDIIFKNLQNDHGKY